MSKGHKEFQIFPKQYGFFPYVFLIYLIMPLGAILQSTGFKMWFGLLMVVIFFISYRQLYWVPNNFLFWLNTQLVILFILAVFYSPYQIYLGFFPANFIGWVGSKEAFKKYYSLFAGTLTITYIITFFTHDRPFDFSLLIDLPFIAIMLMAPFGIRSFNTRMELEKQLDEANEQIKILIKKEERFRIARDLHDTLGHTLSFITLQSQLAQRFIERDPERAKQVAKEIETTSRTALRQVRELVSDMRTTTIIEELSEMERILAAAKIDLHKNGVSDFSNIPLLKQNIISMCLRETTTNIIKHSKAKNCFISFEESDSHLQIAIKDDGVGFGTNVQFGNGIKGMKERLALVGGELSIKTQPPTEYQFVIPLISTTKKEERAI